MELVAGAKILGIEMKDLQVEGSGNEPKEKPLENITVEHTEIRENKCDDPIEILNETSFASEFEKHIENLDKTIFGNKIENLNETVFENKIDNLNIMVPKNEIEENVDTLNNKGQPKTRKYKSEATKFPCNYCIQIFVKQDKLDRHIEIHNSIQKEKEENPSRLIYICQVCSREFLVKGTLKLHMFTHTGEKPFKCEQCDKCFNQKVNLKRHTSEIHGQRDLVCTVCDLKFKSLRYLEKHTCSKSSVK